MPKATVYVRINSSFKCRECRVVDVWSHLDLVVLRVPLGATITSASSNVETFSPVQYGSSSKLLVGKDWFAITKYSRQTVNIVSP